MSVRSSSPSLYTYVMPIYIIRVIIVYGRVFMYTPYSMCEFGARILANLRKSVDHCCYGGGGVAAAAASMPILLFSG